MPASSGANCGGAGGVGDSRPGVIDGGAGVKAGVGSIGGVGVEAGVGSIGGVGGSRPGVIGGETAASGITAGWAVIAGITCAASDGVLP